MANREQSGGQQSEERQRSGGVDRWLAAADDSDPHLHAHGHEHGGNSLGLQMGTGNGRQGIVLTASDRAARALTVAYNARRQDEGLEAWITPAIFSWDQWIHEHWMKRNEAGLMLLNPLQEHALWMSVIHKSEAGRGLLHRDRLAGAAQQAYRLMLSFVPKGSDSSPYVGWSGDPAIFSGWIQDFESQCRREGLLSASHLVQSVARSLRLEQMGSIMPTDGVDRVEEVYSSAAGTRHRPLGGRQPLLLIGFDRLLKSQTAVLDAWGDWRQEEPGGRAPDLHFYAASDPATELACCVRWLHQRLAANPGGRLLVIVPDLEKRRGEVERALLDAPRIESELGLRALDFEFSLGVPLTHIAVARGAVLLLRWLAEPLSEAEVDWVLSSGISGSSLEEEIQLAGAMHAIRDWDLARPEWRLDEFLAAGRALGRRKPGLPSSWVESLSRAATEILGAPAWQSPLDWARLAGEALRLTGWPGFRPESSIAFQARERWETVLESCGSLGYDGSRVSWPDFLATVKQAASATIFSVESSGARIQITGPLESAGQTADGIWFLGAQEDQWPPRGIADPLLPIGLQRDAEMPHSSPAVDWKLAQQVTQRLIASAPEVVFSCAESAGELETRPSRLVAQDMGRPLRMPEELSDDSIRNMEGRPTSPKRSESKAESFEDWSRVPFGNEKIAGGSGTLTSQSRCPFQGFATARLAADRWEPAANGLNAKQRGTLLHDVMHALWGGAASGGIRNSNELAAIDDLQGFVGPIVDRVLRERSTAGERGGFAARFPQRYLALETPRLTRLAVEWLKYERGRFPFRVLLTEVKTEVTIAGMTLEMRMDRVDELPDGSRLIIDYKSGTVGPSAWAGERPDDLQMPLYATYAFDQERDRVEGLVFGRVRPHKVEFCGRVVDARATLMPRIESRNGLVKDPLNEDQLNDWRRLIEQLGEDFLAGEAEVNPKDGVRTCERCHLHSVCRVYESQPLAIELGGAGEDTLADEGQGASEDA